MNVRAREVKFGFRDSKITKVGDEQATERGCVEVLHHEVDEARDAKLVCEANAKLVASEVEIQAAANAKPASHCAALSSLELRARQALRSVSRLELESPLIPRGARYAELSSKLVNELEGRTKKVDDILEEECRDLFFVAPTRVFSHFLLHDPCFKFDEVMGLVPTESRGDLAAAMESHMNTLVGKFFCSGGEVPAEEPPVIVLK
ncbi:hypothetical protein D1007_41164 [Hordeum vulgare]|nr:hypothetical protein D1007_41164 [Hordeum vulgare]